MVAPGLKTGRGLEQNNPEAILAQLQVAPGLKTGRGLEQLSNARNHPRQPVAPGLKTGRGLEQAFQGIAIAAAGSARPQNRARIGTMPQPHEWQKP